MGVELSVRAEALVARAALLVAERDQLAEADALRTQARLATERVKSVASGGMSMLATRHAIDARHVEFLWAAAVLASDPRLVLHAEALAGPTVRRGLSVALHARLVGLDDDSARQLAIELSTTSKLVANGLLIPDESASAVTRTYLAPPRLLGFLRGIEAPEPGLRFVSPVEVLVLDDAQQAVIAEMRTVLAGNAVLLLEGPPSSGRISAIARAAGRQLVVLESLTKERILALRRELMLSDALPVIADVDRMPEENRGALEALIATAERIVLTATTATYIRCERPTVRMRWRIADTATLRRQWEHLASGPVSGVDDLATRFQVGPGAMVRAIESARIWTSTLDAATLAAGLRHNISEELGGLAERVEVTQSWDDLVLAPDTLGQVHTLIARVRHKYQVLESWGYRSKIARGTGVPALFSGPPGTGKTMVAGLIARELGLDLYQVDLSQIVSKWVGETEKQLARVFDAAEQGHGLLLFDEADALFGQRSQDVKGAVDRYANLEVNYLLQRVESFGGITILTTNLDQSIDRALKRRLAAHIVFDLPDDEEREQLWRRLITTGSAPLDTKIDIVELAEQFPRMSGANIRNATLAAAFLAASHGDRLITQETLLRAARAEYRSMGHVLTERR